MKNLFKAIIIAAAAISAFGCSKEKTTDPYDINYLYFYGPSKNSHSYLYYANTGEFTTEVETAFELVPARLTKPAPEDIIVNISINNDLVEAYNKANETEYSPLLNASFEKSELKIAKGEYLSEKVVLKIDKEELKNGKVNYLVPVTISSVSSSDVTISESNTFYLTFDSTKYTELSLEIEKATETHGTPVEYELTGGTLPTGWYWQFQDKEFTMTFDGAKNIKFITVDWFSSYYAAKSVVVKASRKSFGELADGTSDEIEFISDSMNDILSFQQPVKVDKITLTFKGVKEEDGYNSFPYLTGLAAYEVD